MIPYTTCMCFKPNQKQQGRWRVLAIDPQRQEQATISCTPQNGLMIQIIDTADDTKEEILEDCCAIGGESSSAVALHVPETNDTSSERRSSRHSDIDDGGGGGRAIFLPRVTSFSGGQEAEERLLSRAAGRPMTASTRPRFLTLHKRRKRKPPTRGLLLNSALLDDIYNGPTQCLLSKVAMWDFNAFALDSVCGGRPVAVLCVFLLQHYNLLTQFKLDSVTVWKCFSLIEEGYHASNPYHNAIHAADVTQAMHCYLQETTIAKYLTPFETLAAIIASVCHDLDHPGVNQPFLIATDNHLAALYNNASVLENHHWRCAMGCLWESGILDHWSEEDVTKLQEEMSSLILATDITRQNEFITKFKNYQEYKTLDMTLPECRHFSLQIALKCADICNPCRPWEVSRQWSHKICDEFYRQGDYERQLRLPVTTMCDRYINSVAKIQTGFIKFVVSPLFSSWNDWLHTNLSVTMKNYLEENLARWELYLTEETKQIEEERTSIHILSASSATSRTSSIESSHAAGFMDRSLMEAPGTCGGHTLAIDRRHSLPLTVPSLLPRTVIRRESLCEPPPGQSNLIFETVRMGEMSVESVITGGYTTEEGIGPDSTADDNLYPEPSITAMGELGRPRRNIHCKVIRRQSLPPLWDASLVPSRILPLSALPATPLQEETPNEGEKELPRKNLARGFSCDIPPSSSAGDGKTSSGGAGTADNTSNSNKGQHDSANQCTFKSSNKHPRCAELCESRPISKRRASLDSEFSSDVVMRDVGQQCCKPISKNIHNHLHHSLLKCTKKDHLEGDTGVTFSATSSKRNKENQAPEKPSVDRHILKTRLWRSLNHDDDAYFDRGGKSNKNNVNQNWCRGRRGSAPILKTESFRAGVRAGLDINPPEGLSRRRGSAPSNQLHLHLGQCHPPCSLHPKCANKFSMCGGTVGVPRGVCKNPKRRVRVPLKFLHRGNSFSLIEPYLNISGCDALRFYPDEKLSQVPLLPRENLMFDDDCNNVNIKNMSRFTLRRGSMPATINDNSIPLLQNQNIQESNVGGVSGVNFVGSGGGAGGSYDLYHGSTNPGLPPDRRRGSNGLELLSGIWRYHLGQNSNSLCSDDSIGISSSGGGTPGTPGMMAAPNVTPSMGPSLYYRRGSLPNDIYTSVELRKWYEAS